MTYEQEVLANQADLDELRVQQQLLDTMEDQEFLAEAQQIQQQEQEAEVDHIQEVIHAFQVLGTIPVGCRPYHDPDHRLSLGSMNVECPHCHTLHFMSEKLTASSRTSPKFGICCLQGQIQLPPFSESPQLLHSLLTSSTPQARKFRDNIRQYNSTFAFTSVAVDMDHSVLDGRGPYSFRIHGSLHHNMGALQH